MLVLVRSHVLPCVSVLVEPHIVHKVQSLKSNTTIHVYIENHRFTHECRILHFREVIKAVPVVRMGSGCQRPSVVIVFHFRCDHSSSFSVSGGARDYVRPIHSSDERCESAREV